MEIRRRKAGPVYRRPEVHTFQDGSRRLLFDVEGLRFFEIDELSKAVLDACEGLSSEQVAAALSDHWTPEEILEVSQELEEAGLISEGPIPSGIPDSETPQCTPDAPICVTLHVSHACNLKCIYCFADGGAYGGRVEQMRPEVARQAVDWVLDRCRSVGRSHINFFGGEPLLNFPLIKEVVRYARPKAEEIGVVVTFGITTNGTLMDEEVVRFFDAEDIEVMVSVDGPKQDESGLRMFHDGKGSYDVVSRNAKRMMAERPEKVTLRATLTSANMDLAGTARSLSELGEASAVLVGMVNETPDKPWAIREEHLPQMRTHLKEMRDYCVERLVNEDPPTKLGRFESLARQLLKQERANYGCSGGRKLLSISIDGSIYFCSSLAGKDEFRLGDVFSGLDSEKQDGFKDRLYIGNKKACQTCWARNLCGGGCVHDAFLATGDGFTPNPVSCEIIRHSYELAMGMCVELQERDQELVDRRFLDLEAVPV